MIKSKTYFIRTYGCQANEADSEKLSAVMEEKGYKQALRIGQADVILVNSCSVRESAENRVFGLINNLSSKGRSASGQKIILTGCMVGSAKRINRRYSLVQLERRLPPGIELKTIKELVGNSVVSPQRKSKTVALVPIMEGCSHFCSYCVVPYARGKEVSRPFEEVICEVSELAQREYQQILLLGQNVNSYGKDLETPRKFSQLLVQLNEIIGIKKISFMTSNPWDLTDEIIEAISLPKIDRYFHLPVQSGDNKILQKMNRPYTALQYIKLVEKIRKKIPEIKIGTDIIVGFPGETKKAFENTVLLCRKICFEKAYIARYSPRPGTAAFKLKDNVPPEEKRRRWQILERLINK